MNQKEFSITITPEGQVEVHIQGYKGKAGCHSATAMMEKIVGHLDSQRETSEAYEPEEIVRIDQHH
ncbi:MAG: DUF2997 domain-containing protein [Verrucomicrobiota bacterium]